MSSSGTGCGKEGDDDVRTESSDPWINLLGINQIA
jgi:hypothetical protein